MEKKQYLIIDFTKLEGYGLSLAECITLIGVRDENHSSAINVDTYDSLIKKGLLSEKDFKVTITQLGDDVIKKFMTTKLNVSKSKVQQDHTLFDDKFITTYRNLFKGLKPGSMGYAQGVKDKMVRFFESNPDVTETQILNATRMYLNSLNSNTYLQQADYFIYKKDANGSETSRLSSFLDELKNNGDGGNEDTFLDDGWSTKLS